MALADIQTGGIVMAHTEVQTLGGVSEVVRDPSLVLALVTASVLTGFLLVAHACCLGITAQHFLPLVQICSFAG